MNAQERFEAARLAVVVAETKSKSTQNKAWREYFAAEDALKAVQSWK